MEAVRQANHSCEEDEDMVGVVNDRTAKRIVKGIRSCIYKGLGLEEQQSREKQRHLPL